MRRLVLTLAALVLAVPAFAGSFVTRTEQTASGTLLTQYYDMSGTGVGPFLKVYVCSDGAGNVCAAGIGTGNGGTASAVSAYGPDAVGAAPTKPPLLNGFYGADGFVHRVAPSDPMPTADQNAAKTIADPGTPSTKAQGVQGSDGQPLARDGTDNTGVAQPSSGSGIRGWLSAIYSKVSGILAVSEADGANTTLGSKADTANAAVGNSLIAVERQIHNDLIVPTPGTVDAAGNTIVAPQPTTYAAAGIAPITANGAQFAAAVKTATGNLFGYDLTQNATTAGYFAFIASATVPSAGAAIAPFKCLYLPANGYAEVMTDFGRRYSGGLVVLSTTSCSTYTANTPQVMSIYAK